MQNGIKAFAVGGIIGEDVSVPLVSQELALAGHLPETVSYCANRGMLTTQGNSSIEYFGGITGSNSANMVASYAKGSFYANVEYMGGIVGINNINGYKLPIISESYFYGQLKAKNVGGIAGINDGQIKTVLFVGKTTEDESGVRFGIEADNAAGGIVAIVGSDVQNPSEIVKLNGSVITDALVFSNISGENSGAICGQKNYKEGFTSPEFSDCYFNVDAYCEDDLQQTASYALAISGKRAEDIIEGNLFGDKVEIGGSHMVQGWGHDLINKKLPFILRFASDALVERNCGLSPIQSEKVETKILADCVEAQSAQITGSVILDNEGTTLYNESSAAEKGVSKLIYNNLYFALVPDVDNTRGVNTFVVGRGGYEFYKWRDAEDIEYDARAQVKVGTVDSPLTYRAVWQLKDVAYVGYATGAASENGTVLEKIFDEQSNTLEMRFSHDLELEYEWYYAKEYNGEDTEWEKLPEELYPSGTQITVKSVADSGYYYCKATAYASGLYVGDDFKSADGKEDTLIVIITKAIRDNIPDEIMTEIRAQCGENSDKNLVVSADEELFFINGGKYTGKQLSDAFYALPLTTDVLWWEDSDLTVTVPQTEYTAYFNNNKVDYYDYTITVIIETEKADYVGITHDLITNEVYCGKTLAGYNDKLAPYFRWADERTFPTVPVKKYPAIYNTDSDNYNDFNLEIEFDLAKGTYTGITHEQLTVRYAIDGKLSDCHLKTQDFKWKDGDITPTVIHEPYLALYCADEDNYNVLELVVDVVVLPAEPIVKPLYNGKSTYSDAVYELDEMPALSVASGSTDGKICWEKDIAVLGENEYYWVFTPTDNVNYVVKRDKLTLAEVIELIPEALNVQENGDNTYFAFESFRADDIVVTVAYNNPQRTTVLSATEYVLEYNDGRDSFRFGDTEISVKYSERGVDFNESVAVTVNKVIVDEPVDENEYFYSGQTIVSAIRENEVYTVIDGSGVNAKRYEAKVTLKDVDNYRWKATDGAVATVFWTINKKRVTKPEIKGKYVYNSREQVCEVSPNRDYDVLNFRQTDANQYDVTVILKDKSNICWADGTDDNVILRWVIEKAIVDLPVIAKMEYYYTGVSQCLEYSAQAGMKVSGDRYTDAGDYEAVFSLENSNYVWKDYDKAEWRVTWKIHPMQVPVPNPSTTEFEYVGTEIELPVAPHAAITAKNNVFTNAGEYEAEFTLADGPNYVWADKTQEKTIKIKWKIAKMKVKIPVMGETMPTYTDWIVAAPIAESEVDSIIGKKLYELSGHEARYVGDDYEAVATLVDTENTCWEDGTKEAKKFKWSILVARIPLPIVGDPVRYTGSEIKAPIVVVDRLTISCITGNIETDAGDYEAVVSLPDTDNYIWEDGTVEPKTIPWSISRIVVDRPNVMRNGVYTAYGQYAAIRESEYYTITQNYAVDVGEYEAVVALKNKNYVWDNGKIDDLHLSWQITPQSLSLPTKEGDLAYTGFAQTVVIDVSTVCVISGNSATAPGNYIAKVSLPNANYIWSDGKKDTIDIPWSIYALSLDDGDGADLKEYVIGTPLPTPTKENYSFAGWYLTPDFSGEKITSLSEIDENTTLYAKWVEVSGGNGSSTWGGNSSGGGLSTSAIVGIAIACAGAAFALILIIGVAIKKKK